MQGRTALKSGGGSLAAVRYFQSDSTPPLPTSTLAKGLWRLKKREIFHRRACHSELSDKQRTGARDD